MYMYYLLGYCLLGNNDDPIYSNQSDVGGAKKRTTQPSNQSNLQQRSRIFRSMNTMQRLQVSADEPLREN